MLGAGGFIGTNLCRALAAAGASVRAFGRPPLFPAALPPLSWISADLENHGALADALDGVEVVFHLLGGSIPAAAECDAAADLRTNAAQSLELLEYCRMARVKRIVFISSGGTVYGVPRHVPIAEDHPTDPISVYGIHKLLVEKHLGLMAHRHGIRTMVLRAANPYGPFQTPGRGQGVIATLISQRLAGQPVEVWGDGSVTRDFLHVADLTDAMLLAALYDGPHSVMNVGSGKGRTVLDVVASIDAMLGLQGAEIRYKAGRAVDVPANVLDTTLIRRELGWTARRDWMQGLAETAEWLRKAELPPITRAGQGMRGAP